MTPLGLRKKIAACFSFIISLWFFGLIWFYGQIPQARNNIAVNAADAIVVLTGDSGRLEYGLELLAQKKGKLLFISGAGEKVTVADILRQASSEERKNISEEQIILGHYAENTIGNAQETSVWLEQEKYKKIILVTSNYHMPRSLLELSNSLPDIYIIPAPVINDSSDLIFSEYNKYLASKLRHIFVSVIE